MGRVAKPWSRGFRGVRSAMGCMMRGVDMGGLGTARVMSGDVAFVLQAL